MYSSQFKMLVKKTANKTTSIRVHDAWQCETVEFIPDPIPGYIGSIVRKLDEQINKFCREDECLLIYDFQLIEDSEHSYCSLDAVIKPLFELEKTHNNAGKPFQVIVEGSTRELMNTSECTVRMGVGSQTDMSSRETYWYAHHPRLQNKYTTDLKRIEKIKEAFVLLQGKDL